MLFNRPFCIYGAGIVACSIYTAIKTLYHINPIFFLVSNPREESRKSSTSDQIPREIDGITVKSLSEWEGELQDDMSISNIPAYYLIAAPEEHHAAIIDSLHSMKTVWIEDSQLILFTNELENNLMEAYCRSLPGHVTISNILAEGQAKAVEQNIYPLSVLQVYQAKSHMDRPLHSRRTGTDSRLTDSQPLCQKNIYDASAEGVYLNSKDVLYIYPIQVGAALTDQQIAGLQDNQGDNISAKNRNYCELTGTYYAWKHSHAAYKGICHYRRIFDISEEQMQRLLQLQHEWDVILPYPSIHYPNISTQHSRYVKEGDWNAMLQALKEIAPDYLEAYEKSVAAGEQCFYNFNMLIAKAPVFDDYCDFLFRILERTEELTTPKGWERADRFAGYLGENLTTIYFLKNRDKWKIAYAGKIWLT